MYIPPIYLCIYIHIYVYVVQKRPSKHIPRPCHAHKVDNSPAFQQYRAEETDYATTIIFNLVEG